MNNTVTMPCIECAKPVTFVTDNPANPDAPYCVECLTIAMGA